jgi:hypothetical protein
MEIVVEFVVKLTECSKLPRGNPFSDTFVNGDTVERVVPRGFTHSSHRPQRFECDWNIALAKFLNSPPDAILRCKFGYVRLI